MTGLAITIEDFMDIETQYKIATLEREKAQLQEKLDLQLEISRNAFKANCEAQYKASQRTGWMVFNLIAGFGLGALWMYVVPTVFEWLRGLL